MIDGKDLEALNKICEEIEALGFTKPQLGILGVNDNPRIHLSFSKVDFRPEKE
jgi:hypothetical protein